MNRTAKLPLIAALEARLASTRGAVPTALAPFEKGPPSLPESDLRVLGQFARREFLALSRLLDDPHDAVRHAAAAAIGLSRDPRAPAVVLRYLRHQRDFYDHDYGYQAIRRLGRRSLEVLGAAALSGSRDERWHAVQALGNAGPGAVPILRRVLLQRRRLPRDFFWAYYNLHDPSGLPDVMRGLTARDLKTRKDALAAADDLLETAKQRSRRLPVSAAKFADAVAACWKRGDEETHALVCSCLGWLGDERHLAMVLQGAGSEGQLGWYGMEALGRFRPETSRPHLLRFLEDPDLARATSAAVCLLRQRGLGRSERARALSVLLAGLGRLPGDEEWCAAAGLLRDSAALRRAVLERAATAGVRQRGRLLDALRFSLVHDPRKRRARVRSLLSQCPPAIRSEAAKVLSG